MYKINNILNTIINGDVLIELKKIPDNSINCIVTSPPYWGLRDYDVKGQLGLEPTLKEYLDKLLAITGELKRVLRKDGVMFWNHGDCYSGNSSYSSKGRAGFEKKDKNIKHYLDPKLPARKRARESVNQSSITSKCLVMQNYRLILKMIDDQGWILRNTIVWHKVNAMPSSVQDRLTNKYEPVFMLVKNKKYNFNLDAVRKPIKAVSLKRMEYPVQKFGSGKQGANFGKNNKHGETKLLKQKTEVSEHTMEMFEDMVEVMESPRKVSLKEDKKQKFITPEQCNATQEKTGWQEGSGRIRSFFDNYGGKANPKGKNPGDVWRIATQPFSEAHFAVYPENLIIPIIKAGSEKGGVVLDPFMGAGTTAVVAQKLLRNYIGIELNTNYIGIARKRLLQKPMI